MKESGDLLITKEVIHHWPNKEVDYYFKTIVPRFKYVLLQNGATDGPQTDIEFAQWRPLNLNDYEPKELMLETPPPEHRRTYMIPHYPKTP